MNLPAVLLRFVQVLEPMDLVRSWVRLQTALCGHFLWSACWLLLLLLQASLSSPINGSGAQVSKRPGHRGSRGILLRSGRWPMKTEKALLPAMEGTETGRVGTAINVPRLPQPLVANLM
jgi:hypothetical protein